MQAGVRLNGRREQGGAEAPQRVGARAAARSLPAEDLLPRLLRRWGVPAAPWQPAVAQLSPLLDWTDAVHLAQALSSGDAAATDPIELRPLHTAAQAALHRLGSEMRADFADALLARESSEPLATPLPLADALAPYRLHHAQRQRAMASRVARCVSSCASNWPAAASPGCASSRASTPCSSARWPPTRRVRWRS